jgi:hypothetical protein
MTRYVAVSNPTSTVANWGTPDTLTAYIPVISEGIKEDNQNIFDRDVSSRSSRAQNAGGFDASGPITWNPRPDDIGELLAGCLGSAAVGAPTTPAGCSSAKEHTIKMGSGDLPHLTLEVGVDNPADIGVKTYDTMMVDSLEFSHDAEGRLEATAEVKGRSLDISGSMGTPSWSTLNPFVFHMADFKIATVSNTDIENCSFKFSNNLEKKPEPNTRFPGRWKPGDLMVEGNFDISFENTDMFERFLGLITTAQTPQDTIAPFQFQVEYTSYTVAEECTGTAYYRLYFDFPSIVPKVNAVNIDGRKRAIQNIEFEALLDVTDASPVVAYLLNLETVAYIS